jgi:hypothetical protein
MIELLGWMSSVVVLVSMTFKTMWKLRLMNSVACVMWICYGYFITNNPTMFVNLAILITHMVWFIKSKTYEKN